jgi:hypothetical protein
LIRELLLTWIDDKGASMGLPRVHQLMQAAKSIKNPAVRELYLLDQTGKVWPGCAPMFNEYMLRIMAFKLLHADYKVQYVTVQYVTVLVSKTTLV